MTPETSTEGTLQFDFLFPGVTVKPYINSTSKPTIKLISKAGELYVKMPETLLLP